MTNVEILNTILSIPGASMARQNKTNFVVVPSEDGYVKIAVSNALAKDTKAHKAFNAEAAIAESSPESKAAAATIAQSLAAISALIDDNVEELGRLDAVAGDGDHGIGMQRGAHAAAVAAAQAAELGAGAQTLLNRAADEWSDRAGGTSGALWAVILKNLGEHLGDTTEITSQSVSDGVRAASDAVMAYGGASVGDKTLVDALVPFSESLLTRVEAGDTLAAAWIEAAKQATLATERTSDMMPGLGRARSHGEKSVGTPDPGAVSLSLIVTMLGTQIADA